VTGQPNPILAGSLNVDAIPARTGIALAVGSLGGLDQQVVGTMLHTLATRLGAQFRISEAREAELTLVEHASDPASFVLRVRNASNFSELRLPRPLRLMPLADALNASIDIVRPQSLSTPAVEVSSSSLVGLLCGSAANVPLRVEGTWGACVLVPGSDEIAFDRSYLVVARALAEDARVVGHAVVKPEVAAATHAAARVRLRCEEIRWLSGPSAEAMRAIAVKLSHPDAFITLRIWPNLARLPDHRRWIDAFATMQRGAGVAQIFNRAAAHGIADAQLRRGLALLFEQRQVVLSQRRPVPPTKVISVPPSLSFLQRLKQRLSQMMDVS